MNLIDIFHNLKDKLDKINLVLNRVRGDLIINKKMLKPSDVKEILNCELLGILPEEDKVFLSLGKSLPKNSDSYKCYKLLAQNLIKNKSVLFDVTSKYSGFLGSIRRGLKGVL